MVFNMKNGKALPLGSAPRFYDRRDGESNLSFLDRVATSLLPTCGHKEDELRTLIINHDYVGLIKYSIDYSDPCFTVLSIASVRQILSLYKKNDSIKVGIDTEKEGYVKFLSSEISCRKMNDTIRNEWWSGLLNSGCEATMFVARRKIATILGQCPSLADLKLSFGPGSSTTVMEKTTARHKLDAVPVCSKDAITSLQELWPCVPGYAYAHKGKCRVGYGRLSFVPKNAETMRPTIVEPILNTFVQKGIGTYIRDRLRIFGVDIKNGQPSNIERARTGSLTGYYGTIDLSSASDMIAYLLVLDLLPSDWGELLCNWRTSTVEYERERKVFELEKFSSMGNGFTFELETLIFYSLCWAAAKVSGNVPDVTVYGDDIIVPHDQYSGCVDILAHCGFIVNNDKSYNDGPFRESCGGDFYCGSLIRPFYQKTTFTSASIVGLLNHFSRSEINVCNSDLFELLMSYLPPHSQIFGPDGFGDGHIVCSNYTPVSSKESILRGWDGHFFFTLQKVPKESRSPCPIGDDLLPYYQTSLGSNESRQSHNPYVIGGGETCKRVKIYKLP